MIDEICRYIEQVPAHYWALPFIGAFIGYLTNFIAVKMLFHPRRPWNFLLFRVQGVFPKRQKAFAHKLGTIVSTELFSVSEVSDHLRKKATSDEVMYMIGRKIRETLKSRIPEVFPMAAMFLSEEMLDSVEQAFKTDLKDMVSALIEHLGSDIESELDVHKIVEEKVANFSSDKLEEILFAIMKKEFRFIEVIGAVLSLDRTRTDSFSLHFLRGECKGSLFAIRKAWRDRTIQRVSDCPEQLGFFKRYLSIIFNTGKAGAKKKVLMDWLGSSKHR